MNGLDKVISEVYDEFQSIHSLFNENITRLNDDLDVQSITIKKEFSVDELEQLLHVLKHFKAYVNPDGTLLSDFLEEVKIKINSVESISNLNIQYEKREILSKFSELDYIFFDCPSMLMNLSKKQYSTKNPYKVNIAAPNINKIETVFFNFIPLSKLNGSESLNKIPIEKSYLQNIDFYYNLLRTDGALNYKNSFLYIITNLNDSNKDEVLTQNIKRNLYYDVLEFISENVNKDIFILKGNKTIKISKERSFNTENYINLMAIFVFLVSGEKFLEKITIVRTVFSIYLNDHNSLNHVDEKLSLIWDTVQHYFHSYVSDDLKDFFKNRDSLFKEAMTVSRLINEQTDKLNTAINSSLISLVVGATVSTYTSLTKNNLVILIISLIIFFSFSIVYYFFTKKHVNDRKHLIKIQFNHFINNVYILEERDKHLFREKYLNLPSRLLTSTLGRFKYLFILVNLIIFVIFTLLYLYSNFSLLKALFLIFGFIISKIIM